MASGEPEAEKMVLRNPTRSRCDMGWENALTGLQAKGYQIELSADGETIQRIISISGEILENPTLEEIGQLNSGMTIPSIRSQR
jgi:hypothetical protein